jgi:hypothetical protein
MLFGRAYPLALSALAKWEGPMLQTYPSKYDIACNMRSKPISGMQHQNTTSYTALPEMTKFISQALGCQSSPDLGAAGRSKP